MTGLDYATTGDRHLAYRQLVGSGESDGREVVLITPGGTIPIDYLERDRIGARLLEGLTGIGRLTLFDRRGIGMSDPISDWSRPLPEQWADDLELIIATTCEAPPVVISLGDYWGPARWFAANRPEALSHLVLYEPHGPVESVVMDPSISTGGADLPFDADWVARVCPSRSDDNDFRDWFDMAGRTGASPAVASRIYARPDDEWIQMLSSAHQRIAVPTLVLRRPGNFLGSPDRPDPVADEIAGAQRVDLGGHDYHWLGEEVDELLAEISRFVTGEARLPAPVRSLRAVLFTDIVGSTERAAAIGDARWRAALDRHDKAIAGEVARHGGVVVKTTGDGVLATFPSGDSALLAAQAICGRVAQLGLGVRVGVHIGDVEHRGTDVSGIAVHVAARVMALAGVDEIVVTASVTDAVIGASHRFEPAGVRTLKGCPGTWSIYRYQPSD